MEKLYLRPRMAALWVACITLCGCGKFNRLDDGGFTEVKFARSFMSYGDGAGSMSTLNGGVMIYAYSANYVTNLILSTEDAAPTTSIRLPNGAYSFYAFGYTNSSNPLTSEARCAIAGSNESINLDGTAQTVTLNMSASTCTDGAFVSGSGYSEGGTSTPQQFSRLQVVHCGEGASTAVSGFSSTSTCAWSATAFMWFPSTASTTFIGDMSYRVSLPIYKKSGGAFTRLANGLTGNCVSVDTGGEIVWSSSNLARVPVGNTARAGLFPVEVEAYDGTTCSGGAVAKHSFNDGVIFGPSSGSTLLPSKLLPRSNTSNSTIEAMVFLLGSPYLP